MGTDSEIQSRCLWEFIVKLIVQALGDRDPEIYSACPRELILKLTVHALGDRVDCEIDSACPWR